MLHVNLAYLKTMEAKKLYRRDAAQLHHLTHFYFKNLPLQDACMVRPIIYAKS